VATPETAAAVPARIRRFTVSDRVEHWIQVISFAGLAITGLPQRYDGSGISRWMIDVMGGIESVRIIHRVLATVLMLAVVYHFMSVGYRKYVLKEPRYMVPGLEDLRAIGQSVGHALGLRSEPPRQGRFTWEEKVEYWALVWGTVVMIITGFLLWNPIATTTILPGQFIPAARAAHSGEALLAVLAVIVWHFYHVHVRHANASIFTGYMSRKEMEKYHPLELEAIESGESRRETDHQKIRERSVRFFPVFGVFSIVMLVGIYFFVTFENTAIETIVPPEQAEIVAPVETTSTTTGTTVPGSTTTTTPPGEVTWDSVTALFDPACTSCHGPSLQSGGLSLASYEAALAGGSAGPGVVPGDPEASVIVQVMEGGGHPAVLSADDLATLREWIAAGAPGPGGPPPTVPGGGSDVGWSDTIAAFFSPTCTVCHGGDLQLGGLSLASYSAALAGGSAGPGVVPGDPEASVIVQVMEGGHPATLSSAQLDTLREWIAAGAPEEPGGGTTTSTTAGQAGALTWDGAIAALFDPSCTTCHGANLQSGGLSLASYEAALAGGGRGPGVVAGDPEASVIVQIMDAGGHPAVLSADDLATLREWIAAGAPPG